MTKFEHMMLRAANAQLQLLMALGSAVGAYHSADAKRVSEDIEHELIHAAVDERDETHG